MDGKEFWKEMRDVIVIPGTNFETVYQAFKERLGREIYFERTKSPKLECPHGQWKVVGIAGGSCPGKTFVPYPDKHCRDCGEKL